MSELVDRPPRCCVPERIWEVRLNQSRIQSEQRIRTRTGSLTDMVRLDGGEFHMGSEMPGTFAADGEGPVRRVRVSPFFISKYAVTNDSFAEFIKATGYKTEAERIGWSFVFNPALSKLSTHVPGAPWWSIVRGATWSRPEGPDSSIRGCPDHPVVHVSWNDVDAYCEWAGYRLPTEAEWEYACRGGLDGKLYPWGDELTPGGIHRCNIWQGQFPDNNTVEDGFAGRAPVSAFSENGFGLWNMTGNVWEWVADYFDTSWHCTSTRINPVGPPTGDARTIRGGSYICHDSYCNRYRNSARSANTPDSSTGNLGFRVTRDI